MSDDGTTSDSGELVVGDGGTPPTQACLDQPGISEGSTVGCTLRIETAGTCSPTAYAYDDFTMDECL